MFTALGHAPLNLVLDLDTFEGPHHYVSRFRGRSGWLMVVECTIQSEHAIMTAELVVACDENDNPVPCYQARHLTECHWTSVTFCPEQPPDVLEDMICEEEGALLSRWHREKNADLAAAFDAQEARVLELEGRVQSIIARNNAEIADLRRRRRHPAATVEEREMIGTLIAERDMFNDSLLREMAVTRASIRETAHELEEALWSREDLLVEAETTHIVRWAAHSGRRKNEEVHLGGYGSCSLRVAQKAGLDERNRVLESLAREKEALLDAVASSQKKIHAISAQRRITGSIFQKPLWRPAPRQIPKSKAMPPESQVSMRAGSPPGGIKTEPNNPILRDLIARAERIERRLARGGHSPAQAGYLKSQLAGFRTRIARLKPENT